MTLHFYYNRYVSENGKIRPMKDTTQVEVPHDLAHRMYEVQPKQFESVKEDTISIGELLMIRLVWQGIRLEAYKRGEILRLISVSSQHLIRSREVVLNISNQDIDRMNEDFWLTNGVRLEEK